MARGHQTLDAAHRQIAMILPVFLELRLSGMNSHADSDRSIAPVFSIQINLRFRCGVQGIPRYVERCTECIANDLKDISIVPFNGRPQDDVMSRPQRLPRLRMFL